jgi:hypothetical protein
MRVRVKDNEPNNEMLGRVRVANDEAWNKKRCEWTDRRESETEERNFLFYYFITLFKL